MLWVLREARGYDKKLSAASTLALSIYYYLLVEDFLIIMECRILLPHKRT